LLRPVQYQDRIAFYQATPETTRDGVTYVLLHGLGNSMDFWVAVAPELGKIDRTLAIDVPGFGRSPVPADGFSLDHLAESISRLMQHLAIDNVILAAHSLGAIVALRVMAIERDRCSRLVLVDGTLGRAVHLLKSLADLPRDPVFDTYLAAQFIGGILPIGPTTARIIARTRIIRDLALWPFVANPDALDTDILADALSNNGGLAVLKSFTAARRIDYPGLLAAVAQPVDLVWGAEDHLIGPADVAQATSVLDVRRRLQIPSCGHWPMIEVPSVLTQFIQAWPADGAPAAPGS